jgi:hypothetical protein
LTQNYGGDQPDNKEEEKVQREVGAILKNQKIRFLRN